MIELTLSNRLTSLTTSLLFVAAAFGTVVGQIDDSRRNNPYSPSPGRRARAEATPTPVPSLSEPSGNKVAFIMQGQGTPTMQDVRPTVAQRTYSIAKNAVTRSLPPTEVYKIGVGDVLYVNLKNSPRGSGYYTVRTDGTIDYPLAGENVIVAEQTSDTVEEILATAITLFPDPQIEVKVREYGSHKVNVSGMVDSPGEKNLQREAIPLYVVKAGAGVGQTATRAVITRAPLLKLETYELSDPKTDDVLIYPGNSIEFTGDGSRGGTQYFITGEIGSPGQKELTPGLTLYQSVVSSGGAKGNPKKAVIRRKNEKGVFAIIEHNLRSIKDGKAPDPAIVSGDIVEIR